MCCRWEIWGWSGMYSWKVQGVRCWPNDYSNKHIHCFGFRGTVNLNHKLTFWGGTFLYWTEVWTLLFCPVQHFVVFSLWRKNIEINHSSNTNTLSADKRSGPKQVLELSHLRGQRGGNWWSGIWDLGSVWCNEILHEMKSPSHTSHGRRQGRLTDFETLGVFFKWLSKEK